MKLKWKKGTFSSTYTIFSREQPIGTLENKLFSNTAIGKLDEKEYTFKTTGLLTQTTEIIDTETNKVVGSIRYTNFLSKAFITSNEETITWKYENIWNTQWSMSTDERTLVSCKNSSTTGEIEVNTDEKLPILTGLFVTAFYQKMMYSTLFIIFIPIWITALH